jgi:hypothetical protein
LVKDCQRRQLRVNALAIRAPATLIAVAAIYGRAQALPNWM